jgi:hypothetical protein
MACITVNVEPSLKKRMQQYSWVNWSEVGRQEALKRDIFEGYIQSGKISPDDSRFCETIDWHPVDELPLKADYSERLKKIENGSHGRRMKGKQFKGWLEGL